MRNKKERNSCKYVSGTGCHVLFWLFSSPPFSGIDQMMTYNLILKGIEKMDFPRKITRRPEDLIRRLCRWEWQLKSSCSWGKYEGFSFVVSDFLKLGICLLFVLFYVAKLHLRKIIFCSVVYAGSLSLLHVTESQYLLKI